MLKQRRNRLTILCLFSALLLSAPGNVARTARADPVEVIFWPTKDNTLYEYAGYDPADPATRPYSNGQGNFFAAGLSHGGKTEPAQIQRGLLHFDLAGEIPSGATVTEVTLGLHVVKVPSVANGWVDFWLVALAPDQLGDSWGEGGSRANVAYGSDLGDSAPGRGRPAEPGDATWYHAEYNPSAHDPPHFPGTLADGYWAEKGALGAEAFVPAFDPVGSVADQRFFNELENQYDWRFDQPTDQVLIDVQRWVDDPASNLGWVLVGEESVPTSARLFASGEHANPDWWPTLTVAYTLDAVTVPEPSSWLLALIAAALLGGRAWARHGRPATRRTD